jgi:hypothetical protein
VSNDTHQIPPHLSIACPQANPNFKICLSFGKQVEKHDNYQKEAKPSSRNEYMVKQF